MSNDTYETRLKRVNDAMSLKEPDRVPIAPYQMTFPHLFAGYTMSEVMYDAEKAKDGIRKYMNHFQPDMVGSYAGIRGGQGSMMDKMGLTLLQWAGEKDSIVNDRCVFQYCEKEFMPEEELEESLKDFTGWLLTKYLPQTAKIFEPFKYLELMSSVGLGAGYGAMQFMNPYLVQSVNTLVEIGKEFAAYFADLGAFNQEIQDSGFVQPLASVATTAFDVYSNFFRGTLGSMIDVMDQPENVKAMCERLFPSTLYGAVGQAKYSNGRFVMIPMHKGMDGFLSDDQYREFYWDTLLRLINGLIDNGLTPWIYTEGPYNTRLEFLKEVPKGKCWIHFEECDMRRAKKELGGIACLSGGISEKMLIFGTKQEVIDKTKENMDILAPGGGYIFDLGESMNDVKPELVEVMFDTLRTYGKY